MDDKNNLLLDSIRALFEPIVKVSSKWPPVLAYGIPSILAVLLIVLLRSALPSNLTWLVLIIVLAPLAAFIYMDRDNRHLSTQLEMARLKEKVKLTGHVLFGDGFPVKGARVFVEGVDRSKETDEIGWFQIEVDNQESWVIRAVLGEQVGQTFCNKADATKPLRIILKKETKQPLTISYSIKELDGGTTMNIEGQEYYTDGCKFKLQFSNTGSSKVFIDTLSLLIMTYRPLFEHLNLKPDAGKMRFGQARIPHQLFLHLSARQWHGNWIINNGNESKTIQIDSQDKNLLDVNPPVVFEIEPGDAELIHGAVITDQEGMYTFKFSIEYTTVGAGPTSRETQPVRLVRVNR